MSSAIAERTDLVGLPEAADRLGVHRATVNDMVKEGRLPAERDGAHWLIRRDDLELFAAAYVRPRNAPPQRKHGGLLETTQEVLDWLADFGEATVAELDQVVDLHEGNIRKHLRILEAKDLAVRGPDGMWRLTAAGVAKRSRP